MFDCLIICGFRSKFINDNLMSDAICYFEEADPFQIAEIDYYVLLVFGNFTHDVFNQPPRTHYRSSLF